MELAKFYCVRKHLEPRLTMNSVFSSVCVGLPVKGLTVAKFESSEGNKSELILMN